MAGIGSVAITLVDWGIWAIYFTVVLLLLAFYRWSKQEVHYRYFIAGFIIKVFGGLAYVHIFNYYYEFGDTFHYFKGAAELSNLLIDDPVNYFKLMATESGKFPAELSQVANNIHYSKTSEEWFMVKLLSPLTLISFQSYLVNTLFLSLISFWGAWKLFLVFRDVLPEREDLAFFAVFLVPSSLFWGSGIMKDTITLAGINYIIYALYFSLYKRRFSLYKFVAVVLVSYIIFLLKGYVILAFLPGLLFGINELIKVNIRNAFIKRGLGSLLVIVTAVVIYIGPGILRETSAKYTVESIEGRVKGFHSWHTDIGGSAYNLGDVEYTIGGVIRKIPAALNVTFFRPYIWEARNPIVLIAAFESAILFILCLLVLYKLGFKFMSFIKQKPILYTFLVYSLIFGFVVGFTSYNFGALVRYKIPIYSLMVFILLYLNYQGNKELIRKRYESR